MNKIRDEGGKAIEESLKANTSLSELNILVNLTPSLFLKMHVNKKQKTKWNFRWK